MNWCWVGVKIYKDYDLVLEHEGPSGNYHLSPPKFKLRRMAPGQRARDVVPQPPRSILGSIIPQSLGGHCQALLHFHFNFGVSQCMIEHRYLSP